MRPCVCVCMRTSCGRLRDRGLGVAVGTIVGPAVGFVLTGAVLSTVWINLGSPPAGLTESSKAWLGAWWLPVVGAAAVGAPIAVLGLRFPKHMPDTEHIRAALQSSEEVAVKVYAEGGSHTGSRTVLQSVKTVLTQPTCLAVLVASIADSFVVNAFAAFLPKLLQARVPPSAPPPLARVMWAQSLTQSPPTPGSIRARTLAVRHDYRRDGHSRGRWRRLVRWLRHQALQDVRCDHVPHVSGVLSDLRPPPPLHVHAVPHTARRRH